jgi:hypothetical protein
MGEWIEASAFGARASAARAVAEPADFSSRVAQK